MSTSPHLVQASLAVAAATAAELESRSEDVELLCSDLLEQFDPHEAHVAALCLSRLHLAHLPSRVSAIESFAPAALERFRGEVVAVGASYLRAASLPDDTLQRCLPVLVGASRELGELVALRGAVASTWWSLVQLSTVRGTDPLRDVQRLCLVLAALEEL